MSYDAVIYVFQRWWTSLRPELLHNSSTQARHLWFHGRKQVC